MGEPKLWVNDKPLTTESIWTPDSDFCRIECVRGQQYSLQAILEQKLRSFITMDGIGNNVDTFLGIQPPENQYPCVLREMGFRDEWRGYILYELTPELDEMIGRDRRSVSAIFDTLEEADIHMEEYSVTHNRVERFYKKTNNYPLEWKTRDGVHKAIKAWQLDKNDKE